MTKPKAHPHHPQNARPHTQQQKLFAYAYAKLRAEGSENGTQACRDAGYKGRDNTLAKTAHENLHNPRIKELIEQVTAEAAKLPSRPKALTRFGYIMGINDTLAVTTALATATIDGVLNEEG